MADYTISDVLRVEGDKTRQIKDWLQEHGGFFSRGAWYLPAEHRDELTELLDETELSDEEKARIERQRKYQEAVEELGGFDRKGVAIVDYTDKSFVVFGETKQHLGKLKEMKGRYYPSLKGYLFSQKHRSTVEKWVDKL